MKPQSEPSSHEKNDGQVDMSPEAIDQRLNMVSALYDLGKYLQSARPVEHEDLSPNANSDETL